MKETCKYYLNLWIEHDSSVVEDLKNDLKNDSIDESDKNSIKLELNTATLRIKELKKCIKFLNDCCVPQGN